MKLLVYTIMIYINLYIHITKDNDFVILYKNKKMKKKIHINKNAYF